MTVCRNWYTLIGPMYYHDLYVIENEMDVFLQFIQDSSVILDWIKKLIICKSYSKPKYVSIGDYQRMLSCLPNLEKLYIQQSVNSIWYLEHLLTVDTTTLEKLDEIKLLGNSKTSRYLEERMAHWYTLNTKRLCRTITHLEMINCCSFTREQQFYDYLECFDHLTHLNLISSGLPHLDLVRVLNRCPKLVQFEYTSEYPQQQLDDSTCSVSANRHLESFKLKLPSLPISHITYLAHYIPPHIHQLTIITTQSFLSNTIESFNTLLSTAKGLTLEMKAQEPANSIHSFWHTVNQIKGTHTLSLDISLDPFTPFSEYSITRNNNMMQLSIHHTDSDFFLDTEILTSFSLKQRGINTHQLVSLLTRLQQVKYIHIMSEPFTILDYNSFMPDQSMSVLLDGKRGVLDNVYVTKELTNVLGRFELESIEVRNCRYKAGSRYLHISSHLKDLVMLTKEID